MALRNSRKTRRATGSCELTSILSSITGLPRTLFHRFICLPCRGCSAQQLLPSFLLHTTIPDNEQEGPVKRARVQGGGNAVASTTTTSQRLSKQTLKALAPAIAKPRNSGDGLETGIVHIGLGAFHRAHQAVYTDDSLNR